MGDELNEYTFGDMSYSGGQPGEGQESGYGQGQGQQDQGPKWFRDALAKQSQQIADLNARLQAADAEKRQAQIQSVFEAKGYAPSAAALYNGEPDKVDEWLGTYGNALAKVGQVQDQQRPPGDTGPADMAKPPVLPPSTQADLQRMQQMGPAGANAPGGSSDDDLAAALAATTNPEEFLQVARAHGWQYGANNMGMS